MSTPQTAISTSLSLRPATVDDFSIIARIFLAGLNLSIPGRALSDESYIWERDMASDGKLYTRLVGQLKDECMWVAERGKGGDVVGYVTWVNPRYLEVSGPASDDKDSGEEKAQYTPGELTFLFVDPTAHGRGIGSRLIRKAQESASEAFRALTPQPVSSAPEGKVITMKVNCFARNAPAIRVYERCGFEMTARRDLVDDLGEYLAWLEWSVPDL